MTAVGDIHSYLFASCIITRGPSNDSPQFGPAVLQAAQFIHFDRLLADAAYDGEHNHQLCRDALGIRSTVIELNPRRSRKWPKSKYRRQMKTRFPRRLFGQRWHIESMFSQHKRVLGSSLRSRTDASRERECYTRVLTHNLMILKRVA
jgi:transposase